MEGQGFDELSAQLQCEYYEKCSYRRYHELADTGGRFTNSRIGPTWDNPKLRHFYWSLSQSADSTANKNNVINLGLFHDPHMTDPTVSATAPVVVTISLLLHFNYKCIYFTISHYSK